MRITAKQRHRQDKAARGPTGKEALGRRARERKEKTRGGRPGREKGLWLLVPLYKIETDSVGGTGDAKDAGGVTSKGEMQGEMPLNQGKRGCTEHTSEKNLLFRNGTQEKKKSKTLPRQKNGKGGQSLIGL